MGLFKTSHHKLNGHFASHTSARISFGRQFLTSASNFYVHDILKCTPCYFPQSSFFSQYYRLLVFRRGYRKSWYSGYGTGGHTLRYGRTLRYPAKRYDSGKNRGQELSRMSPAHQYGQINHARKFEHYALERHP